MSDCCFACVVSVSCDVVCSALSIDVFAVLSFVDSWDCSVSCVFVIGSQFLFLNLP